MEIEIRNEIFFTITLPQVVDGIQNKFFDEVTDDSDDLQ